MAQGKEVFRHFYSSIFRTAKRYKHRLCFPASKNSKIYTPFFFLVNSEDY